MSALSSVRRISGIPRLPGGAALVVSFLVFGCGAEEVEGPMPLFDDVPIRYPLELWDRDVEGTTILRVRVDREGSVDSVSVLESSGYDSFDSAAVRGGRELRFRPARRNGETASVWAEVPVRFSKSSGSTEDASPDSSENPPRESPEESGAASRDSPSMSRGDDPSDQEGVEQERPQVLR